jgi:hypothetical protein
MHHPQIYDTIAIIEDFFLLTDTQFRCQIEPVLYSKSISKSISGCSEDTPVQDYKGFRIIRTLNHGRIEVNIFGFFSDNDSMDFQYFRNDEKQPFKLIEILTQDSNSYDIEAVKAAIREIMILDRESAKLTEVPN